MFVCVLSYKIDYICDTCDTQIHDAHINNMRIKER